MGRRDAVADGGVMDRAHNRTLTIKDILEAKAKLDALPRPTRLFAYSLWPLGGGIGIECDHETRIVANPHDWKKLKEIAAPSLDADLRWGSVAWCGLTIIDLDAERNRELRIDVMTDLVARLYPTS